MNFLLECLTLEGLVDCPETPVIIHQFSCVTSRKNGDFNIFFCFQESCRSLHSVKKNIKAVAAFPLRHANAAQRYVACLVVPEVAVPEAGVGQPGKCVDSVGTAHQGDRVAFWFSRGFLLHVLALAVLGEPGDRGAACRICGCS